VNCASLLKQYPPYNFKEGDKLTGFEVELGELLAREMDVRSSFITDDADLLTGVATGKYDVAINHIAKTAELEDQFDFSEAYREKPELAIPFQKGNPAFKTSLDGALKRVKDDGRLKALSQKWFESDTPTVRHRSRACAASGNSSSLNTCTHGA
jgi:ABC-type amino acid transport substrate-binding protein